MLEGLQKVESAKNLRKVQNPAKETWAKLKFLLVGGERIELSTIRLKVGCSTTELPAHKAHNTISAELCERGEAAF